MESRKGDHLLVLDEEKHRYTLDGRPVPGTTTFCKGGYPTSDQLTGWKVSEGSKYTARIIQRLRKNKPLRVIGGELLAKIIRKSKKASEKVAKRAANIGTIVHDYAYITESGRAREALQMLSEHEVSEHWEKINNGAKKFDEWRAQNTGETVLLEAIVASVAHQYGGKFDHLSLRDGRLILSDYKTSTGIYVDHFIQLAAYAVAIEEWLSDWLAEYKLPLQVGGLEILRFGKEDGEYQPLLITNEIELRQLKAQAIRCRETYKFRLGWEADKRFKFNGGANGTSGNSKTPKQGVKPLPRKQRVKNATGKVGASPDGATNI